MSSPLLKLSGEVILVVDDEPQILEMLKEEIEFYGAKVFEAANGKDAFEILQAEHCDMVISDIRMPGGDGIEFIKMEKNQDVFVPVFLFISGFSDLDADEACDLGAEALLSKHCNLNELIELIEFHLLPAEKRLATGVPDDVTGVSIDRTFDSLEDASQKGAFVLGRGGVYTPRRRSSSRLDLYPKDRLSVLKNFVIEGDRHCPLD